MRRRDEILVGIFTLVAVLVLIAGTLWLARGGLSRGYPLYAKFAWGAGLKQGQSVLFSGVNVGYVDEVTLQENGGLVVTLRVYKSQRVPTGTVASIIPNGIFGDMQIALKAEHGPTGKYLEPGDTIPSAVGSTGLGDVIGRVDSIGANLNTFIKSLQHEFVDSQTIAGMRKATRAADSMFSSLGRLADAQNRELTRTQELMRKVAAKLDSVPLDSTARELRATIAHFRDLADDFRLTSVKLRGVLAKVDSGGGTFARLLNDDALYQEFRAAVQETTKFLKDFMLNPRKYIRLTIF
jgi:phospholipid/cholesterol/gamma-HCH transport system substrate-binding protein